MGLRALVVLIGTLALGGLTACSGSPATPTAAPLSLEAETAERSGDGAVSTSSRGAILRSPTCPALESVALAVVEPEAAGVDGLNVRAAYEYADPSARPCGAPAWSVFPQVDLITTADPFVIAITLPQEVEEVLVTATAPNGLSASLPVKLVP